MFRVLNSAGATFSLLLEQDLFDIQDPMAIPSRVASHDPELRMPQVGELKPEEVDGIRRFGSRGGAYEIGRRPRSSLLARGGTQFGWVGQKTMQPIPIHPETGDLDPRYDRDGNLRPGYDEPSPGFITPNHGHIYPTALKLAGVNYKGAGKNESPHLPFILREGV